MRIARLQLEDGTSTLARLQPDGRYTILTGGAFEPLIDTGVHVEGIILAPVEPRAIFCIGLNYRKHAEETKAALPEFPVLFMKSPGAVQNPGAPIQPIRTLKTHPEEPWQPAPSIPRT